MRIFLSCILVILLSVTARADSFDLHYQPSTIKITTPDKGVIAALLAENRIYLDNEEVPGMFGQGKVPRTRIHWKRHSK